MKPYLAVAAAAAETRPAARRMPPRRQDLPPSLRSGGPGLRGGGDPLTGDPGAFSRRRRAGGLGMGFGVGEKRSCGGFDF